MNFHLEQLRPTRGRQKDVNLRLVPVVLMALFIAAGCVFRPSAEPSHEPRAGASATTSSSQADPEPTPSTTQVEVQWTALEVPPTAGVTGLGHLGNTVIVTDGQEVAALVDRAWQPVQDGVVVTDAFSLRVAAGFVQPLPASDLLTYDHPWWTGAEVVEAGWGFAGEECGGTGQVAVSAYDPVSAQRREEPWPLPLPCFEGLTSVWTGQELVVFVWASKDACGRVDAPEVCTVMAGWHPQTGWDIRGVVPDIRTAVWADDRVLAVTDQLRLIEVGSDATVTDLGAVSAPPSRDAEWIPRGLVLWGDNGGAGRLVAPDGAESILPLPPGAATVGDVIGLDGDIIALSLDDGGQLQAWRGVLGPVRPTTATPPVQTPSADPVKSTAPPQPLAGPAIVPADDLIGAQERKPVLVEGWVTFYDDEPIKICSTLASAAATPRRCGDSALQVKGLGEELLPHTVRNNDLVRFTQDQILLEGTVNDGVLEVTRAPPKIDIDATAVVEPSAAGTSFVEVGSGRQDFPSLGQQVEVIIDVRRGDRWVATDIASALVVKGDPDGEAALYPSTCPDDGSCLAGLHHLDTSAMRPGSIYRFDVPLDGGVGSLVVTLTTAPADDQPRPF